MRGTRLGMMFVMLTTMGCRGDVSQSSYAVRDSAGLEIVGSPSWAGHVVWADAGIDRLVLGEAVGSDRETFDRIRSVARLDDGTLVVADGGSNEIRLFAADGSFERAFGGSGGGPAEFERLAELVVVEGELIVAHDAAARRLAVFTREGSLESDGNLPTELAGMELVGRLAQDVYLFATAAAVLPATSDGLHRLQCTYMRYDVRSGRTDTLATVSGFEFYVENGGGYEIPFGHTALRAVGDGFWFTASNDQFVIQLRDLDGRVVRRLEYPAGEVALGGRLVDSLETATIAALGTISERRRNAVRRLFREVPRPSTRPTFSKLVVDQQNGLWVSDWVSTFVPPDKTPRTWWVFSSEGRLLGTVSLPQVFDVVDVGEDWILGIETDELGVQRVVLRELKVRAS